MMQQLGDEELLIKHLDRVILRTDFLETKAEILRRIPRWRDATVEKPEDKVRVLCLHKIGMPRLVEICSVGKWNGEKCWLDEGLTPYGFPMITHWMPLPTAPTTREP